jgi:hypothetical protein
VLWRRYLKAKEGDNLFDKAARSTVGIVIIVWGAIWIWFGTPVVPWRVPCFIIPGIVCVIVGVIKLWVDLSD